ncbi:hypothetical protein EN45_052350 [Penicillium chrysogenum]|uniref:F-box domain-containing protein n=1 Tax=Penicillium chrysogenum TaxID=5076 RepID=A0A167S221_PENCH|nr:hypothetical protein EN45_052350 [Penicillium chrysogenum]
MEWTAPGAGGRPDGNIRTPNNIQKLRVTKGTARPRQRARQKQKLKAHLTRHCSGSRSQPERMAGQFDGIGTKSAINKVMDTPEILEMILSGTDMRTLLTSAQRVCRNWTSLISNSRTIQKVLFFIPINDSEWGMGEKIPNPLLTETFASFFPVKTRPDRYQFDFRDLVMTRDASTMARFVRADASWRKMLVQQPPISEIGLFHICHAMGGDSAESASIPVSLQPAPRSDFKY